RAPPPPVWWRPHDKSLHFVRPPGRSALWATTTITMIVVDGEVGSVCGCRVVCRRTDHPDTRTGSDRITWRRGWGRWIATRPAVRSDARWPVRGGRPGWSAAARQGWSDGAGVLPGG